MGATGAAEAKGEAGATEAEEVKEGEVGKAVGMAAAVATEGEVDSVVGGGKEKEVAMAVAEEKVAEVDLEAVVGVET